MCKKLLLSSIAMMIFFCINAQAPQSMNYQAIARNAAGAPILNSSVAVRISIHDGSAAGTVVYSERDTATTNGFGLFTCKIGAGNVVSGTFTGVNWASGDKYMQVEFDATGGSSYTDLGTSQLLSVPYALNAGNGNWATNGNDIHNANSGNVGIGTSTPYSALQVINTAANGHSIVSGPITLSTGVVVTNTPAASAVQSAGLYAYGNNSTLRNYGVFGDVGGSATGASGRNYGVYGLAWRASPSTNIGVYGYADSSANKSIGVVGTGFYGTNSIGVYGETQDGAAGYFTSFGTGYGLIVSSGNTGIGTTAPAYPLDVNTSTSNYAGNFVNTHSVIAYGLFASASNASFNTGIKATSEFTGSGNPSFTYGGSFSATSGSQDGYGVYATLNNSGGLISTVGGYFSANAAYAIVGDGLNARKITGTNSVSEIIPTPTHGRITLTCPESPEYWYQDYGTVQVVNGRAHVSLDPILADIIVVDGANPLKVFCQDNMLYSNGFAVVNKTATGFDIIEKNGGTHNGELDYTLIAKPKTNYGEGRFMQAPGPGFLKASQDPAAARAANRGHYENRDKIFSWPADWEVYKYDPADYTQVGMVVEAGPKAGLTKMADGSFKKATPANNGSDQQVSEPIGGVK